VIKGIFMNEIKEFVMDNHGNTLSAGHALAQICHGVAYRCGWYKSPTTGEPIERNTGEVLMLMVSELAEAMEGHRKGLMDDKLPHYKMFEVELADALIRIFDTCGHMQIPIGQIMYEKLLFNSQRADHQLANRAQEGGKAY
jgi:NTP pyrophosphatase (non-canonical NTP hydrolase)